MLVLHVCTRDDLPSFIAALAINPPLASLVQSLELSRHMVLDPELPSLLASLSNVRTLYLWRLNRWETMTAAALAALRTYTFPNITDLELKDIFNVQFSDIACPNLQQLTLSSVTSRVDDTFRPTFPAHTLQTLNLLNSFDEHAFADSQSLTQFLSRSKNGITSLQYRGSRLPGVHRLHSLYKSSLQVFHFDYLRSACFPSSEVETDLTSLCDRCKLCS